MNYITQIRGFWRSHEEHSFSPIEVAIYFYLLETCNSCGWKNPFRRNNIRMQADLGISYVTLTKSRNKLQAAGLITVHSDNGNPNVQYIITPLSFNTLTVKPATAGADEGVDEGYDEGYNEGCDEGVDEVGSSKDKLNKTEQNQTLSGESSSPKNLEEEKIVANNPPDTPPKKEKRKSSAKKKEEQPALSHTNSDGRCTEAFNRYLAYRRSLGIAFKTQEIVDESYQHLLELSRGDPQHATRIVKQSIANQWHGLYILNPTNTNHERTSATASLTPSTTNQKYGSDKWTTAAAQLATPQQAAVH